ncbi:flagellar basal body P-ring formation chaperone FlgA [Vibrio hippocampi]|nr:flagellar basal body P-ring formation chaperone FlgA [Vibrio hippocampi]
MFHLIPLFIVCYLIFFSAFTHAATIEQIENIQKAAEGHVLDTIDAPRGGEIVATASRLDTRVFATDCPTILQTSSSNTRHTSSNITVLVECPQDNWRIYVPVKLSISAPLVATTTSLSRGSIVGPQDVTLTMVEQRRFRRQGFTDLDQVIGSKLKKNLQIGDIIERNDVCVVCRNEKVVIKAVKGELAISTKGTALNDGASGDQVRVKNDKSQRIIEGIVTGVGEITVNF